MPLLSPQFWKKQDASHVTLDQQLLGSLSSKRHISIRQFKYLHRILTRREYRLIQILGIVVLLNFAFLSWKAYGALTVEVPRSGGAYSEGLVGNPNTINPLYLLANDSDRDLVALMYSGLMRYASNRELVPDLAEKVTISENRKEYTAALRQGVVWHDGEQFGADDVLFTIAKIQDPATKSPLFASYKDIIVKKKDEQTVVFTLPKPFAPFLDLLTVSILPAHLWQELSPEQLPLSTLNLKPVGTGPWKFRSLQKDKDGTIRSYTLARNNEYYGSKPYLEKLVFKFYPDMETAVQGLKNRHVQGVSFVPRAAREAFQKESDIRSYLLNLPQYTALFINAAGKKELQSLLVRQALAFALDKHRLVADGLAGEATVIDAPIPKGLLGYHVDVKKYPFDLQQAEKLLDGAGLKKDAAGKRTLSLELVTVDTPEMGRVAEMVKEMWERLGISIALTKEPSGTMKEFVLEPRKYDILLYGAVVGSDPDLYPFWHSSQGAAPGLNLSQFSNAKADALLERGRELGNVEKRAEQYRALQDIIANEAPAIFVSSPLYTMLTKKEIKGIQNEKQIAYPSDRFSDLSEWYIKSKRTRR